MMMKFSLAALAASLAAVTAAVPEITMDSPMGQNLLSQARRLDQGYDFEEEFAWLTGYSVKFQGCHEIKQWNDEVDDENDVRIQSKRLVRFRLCPSDACTGSKAAGCTSAYGDYIIDMDLYLQSFYEGKMTQQEYDCQYHYLYNCDCSNDDGKGDDFNEDYCEYDCFNDAGMTACIENNPYEEDGQEEQQEFEVEKYMECNQVKNRRRRLNNDEVNYYVGPYCAEQGGAIKLGLFTDDTCTVAAEDSTMFEQIMGFALPYSGEDDNLIDMECLTCIEHDDPEKEAENEAQGNADADEINEFCEGIYQSAGKCEMNYPEGMLYTSNNNACNYMEGIRFVGQDGIIDTGSSRPSAVSTSFIVVFAMAFAAMAFYVWYLRTRLGVKKNTLL